ncbi:hypothetical protein HYH03_001523 [Edaphochlamys debaryana]|uniref:Uncharacterized protein n=1 Tax=Edaphochlamys debaryana TaxID=47281 RepID=A0A835YDU4_9CHLO|nr:hypothetical protein HYH03_001523 [Edaphochlamys debaryana]|eukprot:KAG2500761.1 hypothetical protein HYH03_001523 [Edaphochlamys debaryana]
MITLLDSGAGLSASVVRLHHNLDTAVTAAQRSSALGFLLLRSIMAPGETPSPSALWYIQSVWAWDAVSCILFPGGLLAESLYAAATLPSLVVLFTRYNRHHPAEAAPLPGIVLREALALAAILAAEAWRLRLRRARRGFFAAPARPPLASLPGSAAAGSHGAEDKSVTYSDVGDDYPTKPADHGSSYGSSHGIHSGQLSDSAGSDNAAHRALGLGSNGRGLLSPEASVGEVTAKQALPSAEALPKASETAPAELAAGATSRYAVLLPLTPLPAGRASLTAAAAGPFHVPRYTGRTRLLTRRIKIRGGADPEDVPPGLEARLAAVLASSGLQLEGVYVRRGCIEVVVDARRMAAQRSGEHPSLSSSAATNASDHHSAGAASYASESIDIGAVIRALELPYDVPYDAYDTVVEESAEVVVYRTDPEACSKHGPPCRSQPGSPRGPRIRRRPWDSPAAAPTPSSRPPGAPRMLSVQSLAVAPPNRRARSRALDDSDGFDGNGESLQLTALVWAPDARPFEVSARCMNRYLPLASPPVVAWQPAPHDTPAAQPPCPHTPGSGDTTGLYSGGGEGGAGFVASVTLSLQDLPSAPTVVVLDVHARGAATGTGAMPVLMLDDAAIAEELHHGLAACAQSSGSDPSDVSAAGAGAANLQELLSDLGCFLHHCARLTVPLAGGAGQEDVEPVGSGSGAGAGVGVGGEAVQSPSQLRPQLVTLGLDLLEWFAYTAALWPLTTARLQRELLGMGAAPQDLRLAVVAGAAAAAASVAAAYESTGPTVEDGSCSAAASEDDCGEEEAERRALVVGAAERPCRAPSAGVGEAERASGTGCSNTGGGRGASTDAAGAWSDVDGAGASPSATCPRPRRTGGSRTGGYLAAAWDRTVWAWAGARDFLRQLDEPGYRAYLRDHVVKNAAMVDVLVFLAIGGLMLRSWLQEPQWRQRPASAFLAHYASLLLTILVNIPSTAGRALLPPPAYARLAMALQAPRLCGYIAANVVIGYLGWELASGVRSYEGSPAIYIGDALALGSTVAIMPLTAVVLCAVRLPTHVAMWRALGLPMSDAALTLRSTGVACLYVVSNLGLHASLLSSYRRRVRAQRRAAEARRAKTD